MDEKHSTPSLKAPTRSGDSFHQPDRGGFPAVDDHLVVPEVTGDEIIADRRVVAHPAQQRPARRSRGTLIYLILATLVFGLSLLPAAMAVLMSPMAFDAGQSREAWAMVLIVWSYPVLVILGLLAAWLLYATRAYRAAIVLSLLPLLDVAALLVLFALWG